MILAQTFNMNVFLLITSAATVAVVLVVSAFLVALIDRACYAHEVAPSGKLLWTVALSSTVMQLLIIAGVLYVVGGMRWPESIGQWALGLLIASVPAVLGGMIVQQKGLGMRRSYCLGVSFVGFCSLLVSMPTAIIGGAFTSAAFGS